MKVLVRLNVRQRKSLRGTKRYHLKSTDYYLAKVISKEWEHTTNKRGAVVSFYKAEAEWKWYRFTGNSYEFVATAEDFLEDPKCPTELLFNIDVLRGLT